MAKGHGHNRKKETRRARAAKRAGGTVAPTSAQPLQAPSPPRAAGLEATRGPVSNAYRAWAADYGRRQAAAAGAQLDGGPVPSDLFLLAPLTTRTVEAHGGELVSVQMGVPLVATRAGGVAVAPDRLAIAALRLAADDTGGAMALLSLGQSPDLPPPDLLFAAQLPAEGMRGARAADALAWYLARALEEGDVQPEARGLAAAAGEALALLRPNVTPREAVRLDPAALADYAGYGDGADERPVPLDIMAPPARGGLAGLPGGAYLHDDDTPLAPLLADLRDYVIGLWPYDYFGLEELTADPAADGKGRGATLAALADLVRRLDDVLAQGAEAVEETLAAEGHPPAWIVAETAYYREARQALRATRTAQELLPRLGPIMFDLEIPPADYAPETLEEEE